MSVICWACRSKDGQHYPGCAVDRGVFTEERKPPTRDEQDFAQRHAVLSDDDLSWCRRELAKRNGWQR